MRMVIPLGFNVSGNNAIHTSRMASKAPEWPVTPNDPMRAEQMRNIFWVSFMLDIQWVSDILSMIS